MRTIRFGIIGSGGIVRLWLNGVAQVTDMVVVCIAARNPVTAQEVAKTYGINEVTTDFEAMLCRDDIDAVYIGTPHPLHYEHTMMALNHGKHVLCEKPMAMNVAEERKMFAKAKEKGLLLMEATWMRFFPAMQALRDEVSSGSIGRLRNIHATFSYNIQGVDRTHRTLNPELGGGGLLDVGVYCLHFCQAILGENPLEITGFASINTTEEAYGVDEQANIIARYPGEVLASLSCAVLTDMGESATLYGTKGKIHLPVFWKPTNYVLSNEEGSKTVSLPVEQINLEKADVGYQYEIKHFNDCLRNGMLESPEMTHQRSLEIMMQCDALRKQWQLRYPME